jgi:hypothetical protein
MGLKSQLAVVAQPLLRPSCAFAPQQAAEVAVELPVAVVAAVELPASRCLMYPETARPVQ